MSDSSPELKISKPTPDVLNEGFGNQLHCIVCEDRNPDKIGFCPQCQRIVCGRHKERHICTHSENNKGGIHVKLTPSETAPNPLESLALEHSALLRRYTDLKIESERQKRMIQIIDMDYKKVKEDIEHLRLRMNRVK